MFAGCKISVSPDAKIPHKAAKLRVWSISCREQGGTLLPEAGTTMGSGSPAGAAAAGHSIPKVAAPVPGDITHLLVGDEALASAASLPSRAGSACTPVHYGWLEGSLAKGRRLAEADFHPAFLLEAAASSGRDGGGESAAAAAGQRGRANPAAVAAAAAASAQAASAGVAPPLRQLAVRSPMLTSSDVQQMLMHLLADAPRPHWLSLHGRPTALVVVELPGLDQQHLKGKPSLMPRLLAACRQQVLLQATSSLEQATQTTAALLGVPQGRAGGKGGKGTKRKQPEAAGAAGVQRGEPTKQQQQQQQQSQQQQHEGAGRPPPRESTAAARVFSPAFYCTTARQMRLLSYPPGSAEEAEAAEAREAEAQAQGEGAGAKAEAEAEGQRQEVEADAKAVADAEAGGVPLAAAAAGADRGTGSSGNITGRAAAKEGAGAPTLTLPAGWLSTSQAAGTTGDEQQPNVVAIDCEMVITALGFELARVTLVGEGGERLLDELVVPDNPVTDYNTQYSGITAAMLAGVGTSVADAQRMVLRHVGPHTALVGHTVENDLKVLRLAHGRCCDSAVLFPNPRGWPFRTSLRIVAQRMLGRTIQQGAHDSFVDAEATLQAVQLKFRHGPTFGTPKEGSRHLFDLLAARGRQLALVAPREMLMLHAVTTARVVPASSDRQAVEAALRLLAGLLPASPGRRQGAGKEPARGTQAAAGGAHAVCGQEQEQEQQQQQEGQQHQDQQAPPPPPQQAQQQLQQQAQHQPQHHQHHHQRQKTPDLLWLQLGELWWHLQAAAADAAAQMAGPAPTPGLAADLATAAHHDPTALSLLAQADELLAHLAAALPPGGLLLVLSGQGNTPLCRALQGDGARRDNAHTTTGGQQAQQVSPYAAAKSSREVQGLAQRAQQGVCLLAWPGVKANGR